VSSTDLTSFLESGCSFVVALATQSGAPFAMRGWGLFVRSAEPLRARAMLPAGSLAKGGFRVGADDRLAIAITAADVHTLRAVQLKGTASDFAKATAEEAERTRAHADRFFQAVHEVDGDAISYLERMLPVDLVGCTVEVDELYDQTPGPGAGAPLGSVR